MGVAGKRNVGPRSPHVFSIEELSLTLFLVVGVGLVVLSGNLAREIDDFCGSQ